MSMTCVCASMVVKAQLLMCVCDHSRKMAAFSCVDQASESTLRQTSSRESDVLNAETIMTLSTLARFETPAPIIVQRNDVSDDQRYQH